MNKVVICVLSGCLFLISFYSVMIGLNEFGDHQFYSQRYEEYKQKPVDHKELDKSLRGHQEHYIKSNLVNAIVFTAGGFISLSCAFLLLLKSRKITYKTLLMSTLVYILTALALWVIIAVNISL